MENREIAPGIEIIGPSLWLRREKTLVINDLHLGYEESLHKKGVLVPKQQYSLIIQELNAILSIVHPEKIVINGDLKHEFGTVSRQEWKDVLDFLDFLLKKCKEIMIIQGNHDPIIKPLAEKKLVKVVRELRLGKIHIVHGDELITTDAETIIIGHEHTAIMIREGSKVEKFKCFLQGKWKRKKLIVVPSFNPLLEGTDILQEQLLSPFLTDIKNFQVFVISKGEVFKFGKVKGLMEKNALKS